ASALVADVSLTEWRDGVPTPNLFLHKNDGRVYVELESGEGEKNLTAPSFAATPYEASRAVSFFLGMVRGPGAIYQTHAIICDPQGTVVPGQELAMPSPVRTEQNGPHAMATGDGGWISDGHPGDGATLPQGSRPVTPWTRPDGTGDAAAD